ncbi:MAG: hypothetical protein IJ477_06405, partial [Alistipes sp.]|nr:hypothetical protein [Alistipes sp.]
PLRRPWILPSTRSSVRSKNARNNKSGVVKATPLFVMRGESEEQRAKIKEERAKSKEERANR